jgi:hypothetical protein
MMIARALPLLILAVVLTAGSVLNITHPTGRSAEGTAESDGTDASISIRSISTRYDGEFETFHIFGEVANNLDVPVQAVTLNVTFYDSDGNATGSILGSPFFDTLHPGEKSAFDIVARGNVASEFLNFSYYKITRSWQEGTTEKGTLLRLDLWEISVDRCNNYYMFDGTVTNLSNNATTGIKISSAFYNEQNQIVATAITGIEEKLDSTKSAEFSLVVDTETLPHFAYYSFNVQSDQYGPATVEGEEDLSNFHSLRPIAGKIMSVATEPHLYSIEDDRINVTGHVPPDEVSRHDENSLVVLKVLTPAGQTPEQATAVVPANGSFARQLEFLMDEGMEGKVFRIRAEYFGSIAENTFTISHSDHPDQPQSCDDQKVEISELNVHDARAKGGNVTDFLAGKQVEQGSNVTLSAILENEVSRMRNVTVIFEVFDEDGVVVYLDVVEWPLGPNSREFVQALWLPEDAGTYVVKSFAVSTLDQPVLLSVGTPLSVVVG